MHRADFEDLSDRVWDFIRAAPFKPREETVTEGLLVAMHRSHRATTTIAKSTVAEEQMGGHDWLWALRSPDGRRWMHLRVQAKMLFDNGAYNGLGTSKSSHGKALAQLQALLGAKRSGQIPVYAFFNGEAGPFGPTGTTGVDLRCGRAPLTRGSHPAAAGTSPMGVTLADADLVKHLFKSRPKATRPKYLVPAKETNPSAMPWECLTCPITSSACASPTGSKYILGRGRRAFMRGSGDEPLPLGVAERPQPWVAMLQDGAPRDAWKSVVDSAEEGPLFGDEQGAPLPSYLLVTELAASEPDSDDY